MVDFDGHVEERYPGQRDFHAQAHLLHELRTTSVVLPAAVNHYATLAAAVDKHVGPPAFVYLPPLGIAVVEDAAARPFLAPSSLHLRGCLAVDRAVKVAVNTDHSAFRMMRHNGKLVAVEMVARRHDTAADLEATQRRYVPDPACQG
jgi:hypothetical protein